MILRHLAGAAPTAVMLLIAACTPNIDYHGYLAKPVDVRELIEAVREHCDRG